MIWVSGEAEYFCKGGWTLIDTDIAKQPVGQISKQLAARERRQEGLSWRLLTEEACLSGPACIIARSVIDLESRHVPRDVSHLLADIVSPVASREGPELGLEIDAGLSIEPGRTELGVGGAVTGNAGRNITHRRAAGND